jgi:hypothetical protein
LIPGRLGCLEYHDGVSLAVYSNRPRAFARLWTIPGVRRWQVGDREVRGLVPMGAFTDAARLIQARRRRTLTPEVARQKGARTAYSVTSGG